MAEEPADDWQTALFHETCPDSVTTCDGREILIVVSQINPYTGEVTRGNTKEKLQKLNPHITVLGDCDESRNTSTDQAQHP